MADVNRRLSVSAAAAVAAIGATAWVGPVSVPAHAETPPAALPLGSPDLTETRATTTLEPGVTLTRIVRGAYDAQTRWAVEVNIPATATSPDPDAPPRSVQDRGSADALVSRLAAAGYPAQAQPVMQPAVADVPAGVIGYRVRLTEAFATRADADVTVARLRAAGFVPRSWYTGWDGGATVKGRWTFDVLTIDPRTFHGQIGGTYGPNIQDRETTSALGRYEHAKAAVNGGFFVLDPRSGAPGDPAGAGVYDGQLESETVAGRPVLSLDANGRHTATVRPMWRGTLTTDTGTVELDGLNRVPGLIRNCGGDAGDQPTAHALHDVTCTDPDELVAFTGAFGPMTCAGTGAEAVLDRQDRVVRVAPYRGVALAPGERSVQGIGALAGAVSRLRPGQPVQLSLRLTASGGATLVRPGTTVINGGPQLLSGGAQDITQARDGMVHPGDPSFAYGWVLQRNPRTFAGVDARGRTLLVTVDGRQVDELGLSVPEEAQVAQSLGMRDAINLDGGGSTAMAIDGQLISHPSDATGERPVGDAIYVR